MRSYKRYTRRKRLLKHIVVVSLVFYIGISAFGWNLILVNDDYRIPRNYEVELTELSNGEKVDSRIYPQLQQMFDDARTEGLELFVREGYRTTQDQKNIMNERIQKYQDEGYSRWEAKERAEEYIESLR